MELRYSEYFNIDKAVFENLGIFNGYISHDSEYYLNPKLIQHTNNLDFNDSYKRINKQFSAIISLIGRVKIDDIKKDLFYKRAVEAIISKENGYIGLGYASAGKKGRGIGLKLAKAIASMCFRLIQVDKIEPEFFELLGVFKEQISVDRMSDMIIKIIEDDILIYTQKMAKILKVNTKRYKQYDLPYNSLDNDSPLFFLPTELLSKLPTWDVDFYETINESKEAQEALNNMFGGEYRKYIDKKKYREKFILEHSSFLDKLIEKYKTSSSVAYDFINDPSNDFRWIDTIQEIVEDNPLDLKKEKSVYSIVESICLKFLHLVEHTNAWRLFYHDGNRKKNESASQQAFQLFSTSYCNANNLDISPESNGGQGPVDFKFSVGLEKVLVELKLSSASLDTLKHCLDTQIDVYEKSEGASVSVLLILMIGTNEKLAEDRVEKLIQYKNTIKKDKKSIPEIIYIDALVKKSASKAIKKNSSLPTLF